MQINLSELTLLQDINKKLVSGYHISEQDVQVWQQLDHYQDEYTALFAGLGYRLKHDARGFFYIDADDSTVNMGKISRAFAVTIYVLIEHFADAGLDPLRALFEKVVTDEVMQQLVQNQYHLFEQLEITSASELKRDVFNRMLRNGFAVEAQDLDDDLGTMGFKLLAPVYRYLDALDLIQPQEQLQQDEEQPIARSPYKNTELDFASDNDTNEEAANEQATSAEQANKAQYASSLDEDEEALIAQERLAEEQLLAEERAQQESDNNE